MRRDVDLKLLAIDLGNSPSLTREAFYLIGSLRVVGKNEKKRLT